MFPLVVWGIVAVAALFTSGCQQRIPEKEEKKPNPQPDSEPSNGPKALPTPGFPKRELESASPAPRSDLHQVSSDQPEKKRKLSPEEFRKLSEDLKEVLKIQRPYGFSCPPPEKLPKGVTCEDMAPPLLDPDTPKRFREEMLPKASGNPNQA